MNAPDASEGSSNINNGNFYDLTQLAKLRKEWA